MWQIHKLCIEAISHSLFITSENGSPPKVENPIIAETSSGCSSSSLLSSRPRWAKQKDQTNYMQLALNQQLTLQYIIILSSQCFVCGLSSVGKSSLEGRVYQVLHHQFTTSIPNYNHRHTHQIKSNSHQLKSMIQCTFFHTPN